MQSSHDKVDLGTVEGRFARFFGKRFAQCLGRFTTRLFGQVPVFRIADVFGAVGISQSDSHRVVFHPHRAKNDFHQLQASGQFVAQLFLGHKQVRIVLSESADASQAANLTRLFPAVDGSEFGQSNRQIAIAALLGGNKSECDADSSSARANSLRFRPSFIMLASSPQVQPSSASLFELFAIDQRRVLAVLVVGKMPAGFVQLQLADVRRKDLIVALASQMLRNEVLQLLSDERPFGCPQESGPARPFRRCETSPSRFPSTRWSRFLASSSMLQMFVQILLSEKRGRIQSLQLLALLIAFPVGTGNRKQFEGTNLFGRRNVGTTAQVDELALLIKRQRFVVGQTCFDVLDFEVLLQVFADLDRIGPRSFDSFERFVQLDDFGHLCFDRRKIVFGQRFFTFKVVIESAVDGRTERQLNTFFEPHHRPRHHVGTAMPHRRQRVGVFLGDDFQIDRIARREFQNPVRPVACRSRPTSRLWPVASQYSWRHL